MEKQQPIRNWFMKHITLHQFDSARAEVLNGLTHLLGVVLSLVAIPFLVMRAMEGGSSSQVLSGLIFGLTMLVLYTSSSLYHLLHGPLVKRVLRVMDHASIYFLIAGTYTPVMVAVGTPAAYGVLIGVWAFTLIGMTLKLIFWGRYSFLHVGAYIAMGWAVVLIWGELTTRIPMDFVWWALAGGLSYTLGTLVYAAKKLPHYHAIWHLFVLAGSACFFVGVYSYLLN